MRPHLSLDGADLEDVVDELHIVLLQGLPQVAILAHQGCLIGFRSHRNRLGGGELLQHRTVLWVILGVDAAVGGVQRCSCPILHELLLALSAREGVVVATLDAVSQRIELHLLHAVQLLLQAVALGVLLNLTGETLPHIGYGRVTQVPNA